MHLIVLPIQHNFKWIVAKIDKYELQLQLIISFMTDMQTMKENNQVTI